MNLISKEEMKGLPNRGLREAVVVTWMRTRPETGQWLVVERYCVRGSDGPRYTDRGAVVATRATQKAALKVAARHRRHQHHQGYLDGIVDVVHRKDIVVSTTDAPYGCYMS